MDIDILDKDNSEEKDVRVNSKRLKEVVCFVIVVLFIFASVILCKTDKKAGLNGILSSFIVSSIFYLFIEFLPSIIKEKEQIPLKVMAVSGVREYYERIVDIWYRIIVASGYSCPKDDLNKIFSKEALSSIQGFDLLAKAKDENIPYKGEFIAKTWKDIMIREFKKASLKGELLLDRYVNVIPEEISYAIYNLQEHNLMGNMPKIIEMFDSSNTSGSFTLDQIIIPNDEGDFLEGEIFLKMMRAIFKWTEKEKQKLKTNPIDVQLWK